jgi:hypothetical protein
LDPGSGIRDAGIGEKSGSGSGMNNPDHIFERLETIFWVKILQFFDADPGFRMEKTRIRDKTSWIHNTVNKIVVVQDQLTKTLLRWIPA